MSNIFKCYVKNYWTCTIVEEGGIGCLWYVTLKRGGAGKQFTQKTSNDVKSTRQNFLLFRKLLHKIPKDIRNKYPFCFLLLLLFYSFILLSVETWMVFYYCWRRLWDSLLCFAFTLLLVGFLLLFFCFSFIWQFFLHSISWWKQESILTF